MGVWDLKALYYGASAWILDLGLNGLVVCYCSAQSAGLHTCLDIQPRKGNLRNHVYVSHTILVYLTLAN